MSGFIRCLFYMAGLGAISFAMGRLLTARHFPYNHFPYRAFDFERNGAVYDAIGIRKWKDKLPDMSVILPSLVPSKKLPKKMTLDCIEQMVQETCIAEFIHNALCIAGLGFVFLWDGPGGWAVFVLYAAANIPFSLIQRYNRPKLIRIMNRLAAKENHSTEQELNNEKDSDIKLQHWARA